MSEPSVEAVDGALLQAHDLTIRFGPRPAVTGVDLSVARGEVLGLLGPNGAGKTTLLRRLAGILPGQSGTVSLDGRDPAADPATRRRIGYLPEDPPLYGDETALGYVTFLAGLSGVPRRARRDAAREALTRTHAANLAERLAGRLSRGQRQRVALAGAIVHHPDVLLLDEPSEGLDPRQKVSFRALVAELASESAVIFSSHLLAEVAAVCERVVVLDAGRITLDRAVKGGALRLRVVVDGADAAQLHAVLIAIPGVHSVEENRCTVNSADVAPLIAAAVAAERGWQLRELGPAPDDLEAAFLASVTGDPQ
ncbi:MAG TPA: ABC transporter ATP-binding protein [Sporichthyaceae bacterium]